MTARLNLALAIVIEILLSVGCVQAGSASESKEQGQRPPVFTEFGNPEMVQILGYDDDHGNSNDAMEPFISRDGNFLFFNSSNAVAPTNLYWATRVDDVTFQYQGEIGGEVNSSGPLNAVASMDSNGTFFFITNRSYGNADTPGYLSTIYSGPFADGAVTPVNPVPGVAAPRAGAGQLRPGDQRRRQYALLHTRQFRERQSDQHYDDGRDPPGRQLRG